ncbi:hypothetical protein B0T16DRAFT_459361 [Cercophora newfieldiana]|uniref:Uncharacterized protein n=1 Tax=Cercophora newfieldiana TaxID=92897 RepID=A0AA40CN96_9PEZI|nr:hypothetical protein B0T16DRAFT_459361 [Cercophora newfieldiana]
MDPSRILNPVTEVGITHTPGAPTQPSATSTAPRVMFECEAEECQEKEFPEVFQNAHSLALHAYKHHKNEEALLFKLAPALRVECDCGQIFTSVEWLQKHVMTVPTRSKLGHKPLIEMLEHRDEVVRRAGGPVEYVHCALCGLKIISSAELSLKGAPRRSDLFNQHFKKHGMEQGTANWRIVYSTYLRGCDAVIQSTVSVLDRDTGVHHDVPSIPELSLVLLALERDGIGRPHKQSHSVWAFRQEEPGNPNGEIIKNVTDTKGYTRGWSKVGSMSAYLAWVHKFVGSQYCHSFTRQGCYGHDPEQFLLAHPQLRQGFFLPSCNKWFSTKTGGAWQREALKAQQAEACKVPLPASTPSSRRPSNSLSVGGNLAAPARDFPIFSFVGPTPSRPTFSRDGEESPAFPPKPPFKWTGGWADSDDDDDSSEAQETPRVMVFTGVVGPRPSRPSFTREDEEPPTSNPLKRRFQWTAEEDETEPEDKRLRPV